MCTYVLAVCGIHNSFYLSVCCLCSVIVVLLTALSCRVGPLGISTIVIHTLFIVFCGVCTMDT